MRSTVICRTCSVSPPDPEESTMRSALTPPSWPWCSTPVSSFWGSSLACGSGSHVGGRRTRHDHDCRGARLLVWLRPSLPAVDRGAAARPHGSGMEEPSLTAATACRVTWRTPDVSSPGGAATTRRRGASARDPGAELIPDRRARRARSAPRRRRRALLASRSRPARTPRRRRGPPPAAHRRTVPGLRPRSGTPAPGPD